MKNSSRKYYIFAPANTCSGGPEALHQLAYYMQKVGLDSYIVYYDNGFVDSLPIDRYKQYEPKIVSYANIEDENCNVCIAPENSPWCLNSIKRAKKYIWWLSFHYHQVINPSFLERLVYWKRIVHSEGVENARFVLFDVKKCIHLCGSKYAYENVRRKYSKSVVKYLVEPISKDFYEIGNYIINADRKNIVLYNPSKPSERMTKLLERARFEYVPLRGYSPTELARKYQEAKLYIDLGEFGGPERIPKEAVFFGSNILVANHNAAVNDFDVAIPNEYKIDDKESAEQIEARIAEMLKNYEFHYPKFESFRKKVEKLEETYLQQIKEIFIHGEFF